MRMSKPSRHRLRFWLHAAGALAGFSASAASVAAIGTGVPPLLLFVVQGLVGTAIGITVSFDCRDDFRALKAAVRARDEQSEVSA